eukprot:12804371-Alexandrium_andersonii.AAC.1
MLERAKRAPWVPSAQAVLQNRSCLNALGCAMLRFTAVWGVRHWASGAARKDPVHVHARAEGIDAGDTTFPGRTLLRLCD